MRWSTPRATCPSTSPGRQHEPRADAVPADAALAAAVAPALQARLAPVAWRHFPDGESLVTLDDSLEGADVAILASLRDPDPLALPLRFAAQGRASSARVRWD